ncbi:MAG TPA: hypothetical protein PLL17_03510 [Defluviitaleaceae bacterium]|nr:hypothetical protein [Defluviitaleaceae bacterium]HPT76593.1 hypothetical protein [Defluviitaleaceae bacterium]HQD50190.1 hypothetical protein [Defluviitaleaceae bacterium]
MVWRNQSGSTYQEQSCYSFGSVVIINIPDNVLAAGDLCRLSV